MVPASNRRASRARRLALWALLGLGLGGCLSPREQLEAADRESYALIIARRAALGADPDAFSIEPYYSPALARLAAEARQFRLGEQVEPPKLHLVECFEVAAALDGGWQDRRERLYLAALDLTLERWRLGFVPNASGNGDLVGSDDEAQTLIGGLTAGFSKLFNDGGRLVANIGLDLLDNLISSNGSTLRSRLQLNFTQPLLAGFGQRITLEALTQSERDLLYEARSYERFRRTFAYSIAADYYSILLAYDFLRNEEANFESLKTVRERNEALAKAGRLSDIQMDQARQDEFRARNRVIDTRQSLENQLDRFKETLGLPITSPLALDQTELAQLSEASQAYQGFEGGLAVELALQRRLDFKNALNRVEDARRRVDITRNLLQAVVDVNATVGSSSANSAPFDYSSSTLDWALGLDVDSTLDRQAERNQYRAAIINLRSSERAAMDLADSIRVSVRDALRQENTRRQALEIQTEAVKLSLRRVDSSRLNLEAGNAQTRDLLESQAALVQAQNARTSALIDYRLAQLAVLRDTELLAVSEHGLEALELEAPPASGTSLPSLVPGAPWGVSPAAGPLSRVDPRAGPQSAVPPAPFEAFIAPEISIPEGRDGALDTQGR